ncbi:MAG: stimulus-sensing domain-containing protein [Candidatus Eiseniibacteriota bacterium]
MTVLRKAGTARIEPTVAAPAAKRVQPEPAAEATPAPKEPAPADKARARSRAKDRAKDKAARQKQRAEEAQPRAIRPHRAFSPLTIRILALNVVALATLMGGLLYLGEYQRGLVDGELDALKTQARIFAGALGETAVRSTPAGLQELDVDIARPLMRRLVTSERTRARLFDVNGDLVADSRILSRPGGVVQVEELPPPRVEGWFGSALVDVYDWIVDQLPRSEGLPVYKEAAEQTANDYKEVILALAGDEGSTVRITESKVLILSVAVPVQRYKKVAGAIMLSTTGAEIEQSVRNVRLDILKVFGIVLGITVLLSFYLAGAIARPIRRLSIAADQMRRGHNRQVTIPDFTKRRDEIGDLSAALRQLTAELWQRMEAIERFAADVAHEIKNPLSSLRSAVETVARVKDTGRQQELMRIIQDDVQRLDRLITDISRASRLDAELSRSKTQPIDMFRMLRAIVDVEHTTAKPSDPTIRLHLRQPEDRGAVVVSGVEDQLVQVLQNILANAKSFSPKNGEITLTGGAVGDHAFIAIDDQGPGIPEGKLTAIFDRFYSERPAGEKFGTHSGLGLSISKQIVEAHDGTIHAENRKDAQDRVIGARFVISLPRT